VTARERWTAALAAWRKHVVYIKPLVAGTDRGWKVLLDLRGLSKSVEPDANGVCRSGIHLTTDEAGVPLGTDGLSLYRLGNSKDEIAQTFGPMVSALADAAAGIAEAASAGKVDPMPATRLARLLRGPAAFRPTREQWDAAEHVDQMIEAHGIGATQAPAPKHVSASSLVRSGVNGRANVTAVRRFAEANGVSLRSEKQRCYIDGDAFEVAWRRRDRAAMARLDEVAKGIEEARRRRK
jgi:hypothetical protein